MSPSKRTPDGIQNIVRIFSWSDPHTHMLMPKSRFEMRSSTPQNICKKYLWVPWEPSKVPSKPSNLGYVSGNARTRSQTGRAGISLILWKHLFLACPLDLGHIAWTGTCKRTSEPMYPTLLNGKRMMAYTRLGSKLLYVGFRLHLHLQPIQRYWADPVVSAKYAWVPWNPSMRTFRTLELGLCFRLRHNRKSNRKSRNFS